MDVTRRQLLRVVAGVTGAAILGTPLDAEAMESRIDSRLTITELGDVYVTGPFQTWDTDEASAVILAAVTQGTRVVYGASSRYQHGAARWKAYAHPRGDVGFGLEPGHALAHATAIIHTVGGVTEYYDWTVPVTLTPA